MKVNEFLEVVKFLHLPINTDNDNSIGILQQTDQLFTYHEQLKRYVIMFLMVMLNVKLFQCLHCEHLYVATVQQHLHMKYISLS